MKPPLTMSGVAVILREFLPLYLEVHSSFVGKISFVPGQCDDDIGAGLSLELLYPVLCTCECVLHRQCYTPGLSTRPRQRVHYTYKGCTTTNITSTMWGIMQIRLLHVCVLTYPSNHNNHLYFQIKQLYAYVNRILRLVMNKEFQLIVVCLQLISECLQPPTADVNIVLLDISRNTLVNVAVKNFHISVSL